MLATLSTTAGTALRDSRTASRVRSPRSSRHRVATTSSAVAGLRAWGTSGGSTRTPTTGRAARVVRPATRPVRRAAPQPAPRATSTALRPAGVGASARLVGLVRTRSTSSVTMATTPNPTRTLCSTAVRWGSGGIGRTTIDSGGPSGGASPASVTPAIMSAAPSRHGRNQWTSRRLTHSPSACAACSSLRPSGGPARADRRGRCRHVVRGHAGAGPRERALVVGGPVAGPHDGRRGGRAGATGGPAHVADARHRPPRAAAGRPLDARPHGRAVVGRAQRSGESSSGLSPEVADRAVEVLGDALAGGGRLTRAECMTVLDGVGRARDRAARLSPALVRQPVRRHVHRAERGQGADLRAPRRVGAGPGRPGSRRGLGHHRHPLLPQPRPDDAQGLRRLDGSDHGRHQGRRRRSGRGVGEGHRGGPGDAAGAGGARHARQRGQGCGRRRRTGAAWVRRIPARLQGPLAHARRGAQAGDHPWRQRDLSVDRGARRARHRHLEADDRRRRRRSSTSSPSGRSARRSARRSRPRSIRTSATWPDLSRSAGPEARRTSSGAGPPTGLSLHP